MHGYDFHLQFHFLSIYMALVVGRYYIESEFLFYSAPFFFWGKGGGGGWFGLINYFQLLFL
jgi:hypothetical protein